MTGEQTPRLSFVVGARNDDYGGDLLGRVQLFLNALVAQVERHRLPSELVVVCWNSPTPLADVLRWPAAPPWFGARVVRVPPDVHATLPWGHELTFIEMWAKNVGIRRAHAPFVLSTNVDLVFSDELMRALAGELREGAFYRADRYDVAVRPDPDAPLDDVLEQCAGAVVLRHEALGEVATAPGDGARRTVRLPRRAVRLGRALRHAPGTIARHARHPHRLPTIVRERWARELGLHTDASGDFTLLSRQDWHRVRGLPQVAGHQVHVDGLFLHDCHFAGLRQVILPGPLYHVEHARNRPPLSRMTAADAGKAPWISAEEVYELTLEAVRRRGPVLPHVDDWGLAGHTLEERRML